MLSILMEMFVTLESAQTQLGARISLTKNAEPDLAAKKFCPLDHAACIFKGLIYNLNAPPVETKP